MDEIGEAGGRVIRERGVRNECGAGGAGRTDVARDRGELVAAVVGEVDELVRERSCCGRLRRSKAGN